MSRLSATDRGCRGPAEAAPGKASADRLLERAVTGRGRVDPLRASGRDTEVGLDHGDRRDALVAGDVHVPQARIEEAGAGPVSVRRACRVVAVVDRERSLGDHDEGRAGVRVPAGRAARGDRGGRDDRIGRVLGEQLEARNRKPARTMMMMRFMCGQLP